jgi:hypothetical protein
MVDESSYYRNIAVWLEKKGYYVGRCEPKKYRKNELLIRKGMKKAQVDVAGVKNVGKSYFDDIEIAVVEVKYSKVGKQVALQDIEQTRGYYTYAHVCYLAVTENMEITKDREEDAKCRNIGLLRIPMDFYKKKPNQVRTQDLEVIHSPTRNIPTNESEMIEFLAKLGILRCTLCGCYFLNESGYEENFPNLPPQEASFKRLERNKVFELVPDKVEYSLITNHKLNKDKMWKHLCLLCIEDLDKLFGINKMKSEIDFLKKEVERLRSLEKA